MKALSKTWVRVLLGVILVPVMMLLSAGMVHWLYPADWRPVEAVVQSSQIKSTHDGTPQWSLIVDAQYEVAGRSYRTRKDVFRDSELSVTEAEAPNWPAGRTFTLYYNQEDHGSSSKAPDGNREATAVLAAIFTPAALFFVVFLPLLIRRARAKANSP
jgi:Protein of unknown function (DUF3592)